MHTTSPVCIFRPLFFFFNVKRTQLCCAVCGNFCVRCCKNKVDGPHREWAGIGGGIQSYNCRVGFCKIVYTAVLSAAI